MNKILLFIFILSAGFVKAQHYTQNIPVDTVIYTGVYNSASGSCASMENPDITLDAGLYTYVNGLQFQIVVDSVIFAGPSQFSPVHVGDVIVLNSSNPVYYTLAPVVFYYRLKLVGTPTTAGQTFPCSLDYMQCACNCYHLIIKASITNTTVCTVDIYNSVKEADMLHSFILYPNPAINAINISGINQFTSIKLYNSVGVLVLEQNSSQNLSIDTGSLPEGIYTLVTSSDVHNNSLSKKIVIDR